jgi:hypothetical protein
LIKDYDVRINYHPGKANVVADALSRKKYCNATLTIGMRLELRQEFGHLKLAMVHEIATAIEMEPMLEAEIRKAQLEHWKLKEIQQLIKENKTSDFTEDDHGTEWLRSRICIPNLKSIWELILREAHDSAYSIHLGSTKMYKDRKTRYWWYDMKRDIVEYVSLCDTC